MLRRHLDPSCAGQAQRDAPLLIWGWAEPHEEVTVAIDDNRATTTADADGNWSVILKPMKADGKPHTLTVTGTDLELTIRLSVDVGGERDGAAVVPARLVGDIVKALPAGAVHVELGGRAVRVGNRIGRT